MRFVGRLSLCLALWVGPSRAEDGGFRYRGTDVEFGGALMLAEVEHGYGSFSPWEIAWEVSPFAGIAPRFGWSAFAVQTELFTAPTLGYPFVASDTEGRIPAYVVFGLYPAVSLGALTVGPYASLGPGALFVPYWGLGAKTVVSFGNCGNAAAWGASLRWTVREAGFDTSHDFALAIRYRFEPVDLRAAHACP